MVIIILGLMAGVGTPVLVTAYRSFLLGSIIQEADTRARLAMERMLRELRGARLDSLSAGTGNSITFDDQDGSPVVFQFSSATGILSRGSATLAEGVSALSFSVVLGMPPVQLDNTALPLITVDMTVTVDGQGLNLIGAVSPLNP